MDLNTHIVAGSNGKIETKEQCNYYLQLCCNDKVWPEGTWEEVSEYVYENYTKVFIDEEGARPRYNGNKAKRTKAGISVEATNMSDRDYAILLRMFGVNVNVSSATGYLKKPEYIKIKGRKSIVLHEVATGKNFRTTAV
jgi:hypothetical protein